jgi:KaiC/GvpD/RAD55 family RecA-like ATPase
MYALRAHYLGDPIALKYRADWVHKQTGERKKDFTVVWLGQKRPLSELPLYRVRFDRRRAELPHVSVIFEGERKAVWAALLWEHNGRERLHPELAPDAEFFGGYGANVVPTVEAMAATLWSDVVHSDTVVFAPDNDAAGHKWCARMIERAQQAAQAAGKALKLYVLEWTQAPEGGDLADLCERTLIPLPGGRYMLDQDAADPWAEIEVWRAAEWLEAHGFAAPAQEHNTEPATPTLPEWLQGALTLEELEQIAEQEPPVWLPVLGVEGIVCEGDVVLVVGGPKVGKTESGLRIVAGWDMPVLYCTEESRRKWAQRAKKLPACYKNGNVRVVSLYTMATGDEWAQRVRDAAAAGYKVIAIDTMRALVYYQNESDNKQAQLAVGPIAGAARECGVTLVLVHHRNKYSSTEQGTSGGNAIDGLADVILRLEPDRSGNKQRLVLHASGRVIESTDHVLEWSSARELAVVGDVATVRQHELEAIVLEACTDTWESLQEIAARCELQHGSAPGDRALRSTLNKLTDRGALECRESPEHSGKGRPPKQWRRAQYVEPAPAPDMLHVNGRQQYTIPDGW